MDNKLSPYLGKQNLSYLVKLKRKVESFDVKCGNASINQVNSVKYLGYKFNCKMTCNKLLHCKKPENTVNIKLIATYEPFQVQSIKANIILMSENIC